MRVLLKNQVIELWKRWVNFLLIFCLLIISITIFKGSIETRESVKRLFSALNNSGYFANQLNLESHVNFSEQSFQEISDYFLGGSVLNKTQKSDINNMKKIDVIDHQSEYQQTGYNFITWLLYKNLENSELAGNYQWSFMQDISARIEINNTSYTAKMRVGFDDFGTKNNIIHHICDNVILSAGRAPKNNLEVVVSPGQTSFKIGDYISFNNQKYLIVGTGFSLLNYVFDIQKIKFDKLIVYFNSTALQSYWLENDFNEFTDKLFSYYIDYDTEKFNDFITLFFNKYFANGAQPSSDLAWVTNYQLKSVFTIVKLQITIYFWVSILLFTLTLITLMIFLKKEMTLQRSTWGILLSLGNKVSQLSIIVAFSYLTILILPIITGFAMSFIFQWYLTKQISTVILLLPPLIKITLLPTLLALLIIPLIILINTLILLKIYLSKPVLSLTKPIVLRTKNKFIKAHRHYIFKHLKFLKWTELFLRGNFRRMFGVSGLFFLISGSLFLSFNFVNSYNYSQKIAKQTFVETAAKTLITFSNPSNNLWLDSVDNNEPFNDQDLNQFHWVSEENFNQGIINKTYQEISDLQTEKIFFNKYISAQNFRQKLSDTSFIEYVKVFFPNLYQLIYYSSDTWTNYQKWPIVTFGFKLFNSQEDLLFNFFQGRWVEQQKNIDQSFDFYGFSNVNFTKFIHYKNTLANDSLSDFIKPDNNAIGAIMPLQMAKRLNVKLNDILYTQIFNFKYNNKNWNYIPIRIVGINYYNYLSDSIIINQLSFESFLNQFHSNIVINDSNNLANGILKHKQIAILDDIAFYKTNKNYSNLYNFNLVGSADSYFMNSLEVINSEQEIFTDFLLTLKTLIVLIAIFSGFVVFLLIFIIFDENRQAIVTLKLLGYSNKEVSIIFSLPYLLVFLTILGSNLGISYILLKLILKVFFNKYNVLLLLSFSFLLTSLIIAIIILCLISFYIIAKIYIAKQPFSLVMNSHS